MQTHFDTVVIGAGQAGLAAGYHLRRSGLTYTLLEASATLGGSWSRYYDSLTLFSPARYSALPGLAFPGDPDRYPTRDEVVAYLRSYAEHFALPVMTSSAVTAVTHADGGFQIALANGGALSARSVIAATGSFNHPHIPELPNQARFQGQILHSGDYRNPAALLGKRIVVVGAGNSAVQIAFELAQVAHVTLATRAPVTFMPQRLLGQDFHFWARVTGLDRSNLGSDMSTPVLDTGRYRRALKAGQPARRPMFQAFTEAGVRWADGQEEAVDVVIFATGYRSQLPYLAKLSAINAAGQLLQRNGIGTQQPGLYFVGHSKQRNLASATLRGVGPDAALVVQHIQRQLAHARAGATPSGRSGWLARVCATWCRPANVN